jgi:4-hydroxy-2-oxoheptanedioate aldolase
MRPNETKRALREGKPALGIMVSSISPLAAEAVANVGFDWVMVDLQHGEPELSNVLSLLQGISTTGATPFVRVPINEFVPINRALDLGAYGIVVPLVNTPEEAAIAVHAAKYPPMGARSWGPVRGAIYGGGDYFRESNDEIALMVMIETAEAVRNVRAIIATEGIDGCYIGPNDLSISYGVRRAAIWASRWPRRSRRRWRPSSPPARRWGKRPVSTSTMPSPPIAASAGFPLRQRQQRVGDHARGSRGGISRRSSDNCCHHPRGQQDDTERG